MQQQIVQSFERELSKISRNIKPLDDVVFNQVNLAFMNID